MGRCCSDVSVPGRRRPACVDLTSLDPTRGLSAPASGAPDIWCGTRRLRSECRRSSEHHAQRREPGVACDRRVTGQFVDSPQVDRDGLTDGDEFHRRRLPCSLAATGRASTWSAKT